jgi:hypothetical protein
MKPNDVDLREFARIGAQMQLDRIYAAFPELRQQSDTPPPATPRQTGTARQPRTISAKGRAVISRAMKKRWRLQRQANAKAVA